MARGSGKDPREAFAIDRLRFRERATDPNVAPPKFHCELYVKNGKFFKLGSDGTTQPLDKDELVKVSSNDSTAGYLLSKIVAGAGIVVTELNDGVNETLEISGGPAAIQNLFETVATDAGTNPVADNTNDTLTLTSSDSSLVVTGDAATDTVDLTVAPNPVAPTTTTDATPTVAYTLALADDTAYELDARVVARRTDVVGDYGSFQQSVCIRRQSGGAAVIEGDIFQKKSQRTDSDFEICWTVSGNSAQLEVTGAASKTVKWQPQVELESVN